jgi:riboflavin transporter FmnP
MPRGKRDGSLLCKFLHNLLNVLVQTTNKMGLLELLKAMHRVSIMTCPDFCFKNRKTVSSCVKGLLLKAGVQILA